jgi:hypothetical protein
VLVVVSVGVGVGVSVVEGVIDEVTVGVGVGVLVGNPGVAVGVGDGVAVGVPKQTTTPLIMSFLDTAVKYGVDDVESMYTSKGPMALLEAGILTI